jgi:hypothetical protein
MKHNNLDLAIGALVVAVIASMIPQFRKSRIAYLCYRLLSGCAGNRFCAKN